VSRFFTDFLWQALSRDLASGNLFGALYGAAVRLVGGFLAGVYAVVPNYALAIVLLTVGVRFALYPLTAKQVRAMAELQRLQPELQRLREKYKNDRARLNEEVMLLYQEHGVNPFGGCLPLLIQGPILFVIWSAIGVAWGAAASHRFAGAVVDFCSDELGQPSQCAPGTAFVPPWSALFEAIQHHKVSLLGIDLTRPGSGQRGIGLVLFIVLVGLVTLTQWYQQHQIQRSSGTEINPQAQAIQQILPLFFGFITYTLAAGLGIYFLVGNLVQIGQQRLLLRHREEAAARLEAKLAARKRAAAAPQEEPKGSGAALPRDKPEKRASGGPKEGRKVSPLTEATEDKARDVNADGEAAARQKVASEVAMGPSGGTRSNQPMGSARKSVPKKRRKRR
jgi:YidC/Oxa1 family membrane protein insertase